MKLAALASTALIVCSLPAQASEVYLVLGFSRGGGSGHMNNMTHSAVSIPMPSMEKCALEGSKAKTKNTKEVRTVFWCIDSSNNLAE